MSLKLRSNILYGIITVLFIVATIVTVAGIIEIQEQGGGNHIQNVK